MGLTQLKERPGRPSALLGCAGKGRWRRGGPGAGDAVNGSGAALRAGDLVLLVPTQAVAGHGDMEDRQRRDVEAGDPRARRIRAVRGSGRWFPPMRNSGDGTAQRRRRCHVRQRFPVEEKQGGDIQRRR